MQQPKYTWQEIAKESLWITIAWEWLQKLLGRAVDSVLWVTMVFAGYQLIPGAPQPYQSVSIFMFVSQFVALDIGGLGLNQLARQQGLPRWAYARIIAYCLIGITLITITYSGIEHAVPNLNTQVTTWVEVSLVVARSVMTVLYGQAIHSLKAEEHEKQDRIAELETQLNTKVDELNALRVNLNTQLNAKEEELNTLTAQFNTRLNTLQQQLNARVNEVNTLRVKVNTQSEEISILGVKLESKETQLASIKGAHEGSLGAIQEATSSVKAQLTAAQKEVESLRSLLLSTQGSLHAEKQKALTLTSENKDLNAQLNALRVKVNAQEEDLNALRVKVNGQNEDLNAQLNTPTDDLDSHKIVHLDTQTSESKNYESLIRSLLINEPGLSGGEIARRLGCSKPTACYWKKLIEKERKEA